MPLCAQLRKYTSGSIATPEQTRLAPCLGEATEWIVLNGVRLLMCPVCADDAVRDFGALRVADGAAALRSHAAEVRGWADAFTVLRPEVASYLGRVADDLEEMAAVMVRI